ncbi:MAG TPA: hypothetical protein VNI83_12160, partial [Vicinamibacterales bacterium]|nr:hypothetical protein [Vicinamibacterales bacterium]
GPPAVQFDAPPGRLQLRFNVENAAGEILDSDVRDVTVPDYTEPGLLLSTPALLRARTPRELDALRSDPAAVPTAAREFRRTERVLIRFEAYAPGAQPISATVRLLNRQGQAMSELPTASGPAPGWFQAELPLAGLAPGEYLIEVRAAAAAGDVKELVAIRLTG